jgi:zinc transport system substrate-binding protein
MGEDMKNTLKYALLTLILLFLLSACQQNSIDDSKFNIVTSFYPMYVLTLNVADGASNVTVSNLTAQTTGCLHDYQITTTDMIKLGHADVLVANGDGMESFIDKAVSTYKDLKVINASDGILDSIDKEHDDSEDDEHEINSHYWVSICLYIKQVENVARELSKIDPDNAEIYKENASNYIKKLTDLKNKMHEELDKIKNKKIVTFHEAFEFFADEFGLDIVSVIEREPGTYPSSRDVAEIIDEVKQKDVKAIFAEPQYSRTAADTIARETKVNVYSLDPLVTGEMSKDAYINAMNNNLEVLKEALS